MKILYYDCFAGISGDMNLAAMIDLGVSPDYLKTELARLGLEDEFCLECQPQKRNGIQGMQVHVRLAGEQGADQTALEGVRHGDVLAETDRWAKSRDDAAQIEPIKRKKLITRMG